MSKRPHTRGKLSPALSILLLSGTALLAASCTTSTSSTILPAAAEEVVITPVDTSNDAPSLNADGSVQWPAANQAYQAEPEPARIPEGISYTLPYAQFDIVTERILTACPGVDSAREIEFSVTATVTRRFAPGAQVTLSYDALTAPTKTTNFAVTLFDNGMLHTINASAEDRTGPIIENIVTGIGRLQLARLGVAPPPNTEASDTPCSPRYAEALAALKLFERVVRTKTTAVRNARTTVQNLESRLVLRGHLDAAEADALVAARSALRDAQGELEDASNQHDQLLEGLTIRSSYSWPNGPRDTQDVLQLPPAERGFLIDVMGSDAFDEAQDLYPLIVTLSLGNSANPPPAVTLPTSAAGALYITPAQGVMRVCQQDRVQQVVDARGAGRCRSAAGDLLLAEVRSNLPQFARYAQLSLENGPFENNSISATFHEDGTLAEAHFVTSRAAAEAASASFAAVANTIQSVEAQRQTALAAAEDREHAQATQAMADELARLEHEQAVLEARIAIEQTRAGATSQTALTQLRARREIAEAEAALARAERERDAAP